MRRHRIIWAAALTATVLCLQTASANASSTLLSGYGGPGQGNQAIIGSALVGGGGGGSGSGSATGSTASAPESIALSRAPASPARKRAAHKHATSPASKRAAEGKTPTQTVRHRVAALSAERSAGGGTLGLTGADVVYIILAFCVLAATALLTARLTGRLGRAGGTR